MRWALASLIAVVGAVTGIGACGDDPAADATPCSGPACNQGPGGGAGGPSPVGPDGSVGSRPSCTDGQKDDDESDVDCGGTCAGKCAPAQGCKENGDCASLHCASGACAAPTCTDQIKNQDESDLDCGGVCPKCDAGAACNLHTDCKSDGCDYNKHCALSRSCTAHHGGDTCGPGPDGDPNGKFDSCCIALPVTGGSTLVDKYLVTAGRMRAFVERTQGNMKKFIADMNPPPTSPDWEPAWSAFVPSNLEEALDKLGPYPDQGFTRQGCNVEGGGARTYWQPPITGIPNEKQAYDQDVLDEKALNCVEVFTLAAFCLWDGGHLASYAELDAAWGSATYPWGASPAVTQVNTDPKSAIYGYLVHEFGGEFAGPYSYTWPTDDLDQSSHIAPPGRKPLGKGPGGHMDLAGMFLEVTSTFDTAPNQSSVPVWLNSGSWEAHPVPVNEAGRRYVSNDSLKRAYWAAGGRCARKP